MKTDPSTCLSALIGADLTVLHHLRNCLTELIAARERPAAPTLKEASLPPPNTLKAPPMLGPLKALPPMRPPRPGSLRADIYSVLAMKPTMSRAEIIAALSRIRADAHKAHFVSKIHDTLNRPHDRAIERVGRGVYRLVHP